MSTIYYRDINNNYVGGFDGNTGKVPPGSIEVPFPPTDARFQWDGSNWIEPASIKDDVVSENVDAQVVKQGVTTEDKVNALWSLQKGDKTQFDAIDAIISQAVIDNSK